MLFYSIIFFYLSWFYSAKCDSEEAGPLRNRYRHRWSTIYTGDAWWKLCHNRHCKYLLYLITKTCLFKYTENFTTKKWKFSDKKIWYFSWFCSKHRLWVLVRTASMRRFYRAPTIYVLSRNKKNNEYPCKPQFYYIKLGFKGVKIYRHVFVMLSIGTP